LTQEPVQSNKAIVGRNAFAHEAGIHQDGVIKDRRTYEIMRPEDVGLKSTLVLGKHSGRHAVKQRCEQMGYDLTRFELDRVYREVIALADNQKTVEDDDVVRIVAQIQQTDQTTNANTSAKLTKPAVTRSA
jgi:2-isopropylmalate synthase